MAVLISKEYRDNIEALKGTALVQKMAKDPAMKGKSDDELRHSFLHASRFYDANKAPGDPTPNHMGAVIEAILALRPA